MAPPLPPIPAATTNNERRPSPLDYPRKSSVDFAGLIPQYHRPMCFPNEVDLYEPSVAMSSAEQAAARTASGSRTSKVTAKVDVALPCGYFNIWRPLHDSSTQPADRLAHYLPFKFTSGDATADSSQQGICKWDSRISYSSADDEYYQNGLVLPFIKTWYNGTLYTKNVFCKTEHDWGMVYLASNHENPNLQSMLAWRFNYAESKSIIDRFHAVLNFSLFAETAAIQWYIRPLTHKEFSLIPIHVLTAEEALAFPEVPKPPGAKEITSPIDARARIVQQYRGHLLAYREPPNELHTYAVHSVPGFAADLSQYVENEYGFEIWVQLCPATEGTNRWQKVQIARQPLLLGVGGRTRDNDDALARCGLDFRIKLRADIEVPPVSDSLSTALLPLDQGGAQVKPQMDDPRTADFTISVNDPENKVGCLQPPIRAHERVLAAGSEYFAALLASSMTESASKQVMLDNMAYGAVRVAINFLYTGEVSDAVLRNLDDWISLLGVAARLSIPRLHQICQLRILQAAITSVQENSLALSRAALKNNSSRGSSSTVSNGNLDDHSRYSCGPADFVSRCQIPCEFPDEEFFNYLVDIADDNGAQELTDALDRIKHYYPVVIQEHSIRTGPTKPFCALALDTTPPHLDNNHHPHLHNEFPVGFGPDDDDDGHSDDNDNDNDNDNEFGRGHFGRGGDAIGMQHMFMPGPLIQHEHIANVNRPNDNHVVEDEPGWVATNEGVPLFGRLLGGVFGHGWRVTNTDNNNNDNTTNAVQHQDPPEPQPGPVPEMPRTDEAATTASTGTPSTPPAPAPGPTPTPTTTAGPSASRPPHVPEP